MKVALPIILISLFSQMLLAQGSDVVVKITCLNVQDSYSIGDTIKLRVMVKTPPEICLDGMDRTKIYLSGLSVLKEEDWQQEKASVWTKKLSYIVIKNKKKKGKITVVRKADKGDFFHQKEFKINKE